MNNKQDAEFYFQRSKARYKQRDWSGGDADLDKAIRLDPDNLDYRWERGENRYDRESYRHAIEDFTRIVQLSTDLDELEEAYGKLVVARGWIGRHAEIIADLDWLIEHGINLGSNYSYRAFLKRYTGRYEESIEDYTKAIAIEPYRDIFLLRAHSYIGAKRYAEAIVDLTRTLDEDVDRIPQHRAWVYHWRGHAYYCQRHYQKALDDFNTKAQLEGKSPVVDVHEYAKSLENPRGHFITRQYQYALVELNRIFDCVADNSVEYLEVIYCLRGQIHFRFNRPQEALADFNAIAALHNIQPFSTVYDFFKTPIFQRLATKEWYHYFAPMY